MMILLKAVSIGFISGYDDGTFRPADNVTYEQAITMIFNVLGYKPVADLYGGYPHAYMSLGYYNRFFKSSTDNRNGNIEMNETKEKDGDYAKRCHGYAWRYVIYTNMRCNGLQNCI